MKNSLAYKHNRAAPYWAVGLIILCAIGLSTSWVDFGPFWKGYVLDITGPAWNYILIRGLFTTYKKNTWRRIFSPNTTMLIFLFVCVSIESAQYLNLYDSTYDPWDFLAYVILLFPLYLLDSYLSK